MQLNHIIISGARTFSHLHFSIVKSLGFSMDLMVETPSHHMDSSNNGLIYEICTRRDKCYHPRKLMRVSLIERCQKASSQFKSGLDLYRELWFWEWNERAGGAVVSHVFEPRDQTGVGSGYPFEWWAFGARWVAANHCFRSRKWSGVRVLWLEGAMGGKTGALCGRGDLCSRGRVLTNDTRCLCQNNDEPQACKHHSMFFRTVDFTPKPLRYALPNSTFQRFSSLKR